MTTATVKTLAEMTTEELATLKGDTYDAARVVYGRMGKLASGTKPYGELAHSLDQIMRQWHRVDDELDRRGA